MDEGHSNQEQTPQRTQQQEPPQEPPRTSHRHKPTEEELKSTRFFIRLFVYSIILTLLASYLELPFKVAAPVLGIAALVFGIIGLVKAVRCGFSRLLRVGMAMGLGAALVLTISSAALVAVWPITAEYETCVSQALTVSAQSNCEQIYQDKLTELSEPLTG